MNVRRRTARPFRAAGLLLTACFALAGPPSRADSLEAIPLRYRLAEDVIPLLQPLLPPGAALTGTGDVLLVRADEATLRELQRALELLDRAPLSLRITVGQATGTARQSAGVAGSATVGSDDVRVGVNRPPAPTNGAQVTAHDLTTRDDIQGVSSVQALEGREVYVATGESRPVTSTTAVGSGGYPRGPVVHETTGYRSVQSGFYATPRVVGDRVTLEISPKQQQFTDRTRTPTVTTQSLQTTVSGRLGEWMELGGVADKRNGTDSGLLIWGARSESIQYSAWVKVEAVH